MGEPSVGKPEMLGSSPANTDLPRAKKDQSAGEKAKEIRGPLPEEVLPWKSRAMRYGQAGAFLSK